MRIFCRSRKIIKKVVVLVSIILTYDPKTKILLRKSRFFINLIFFLQWFSIIIKHRNALCTSNFGTITTWSDTNRITSVSIMARDYTNWTWLMASSVSLILIWWSFNLFHLNWLFLISVFIIRTIGTERLIVLLNYL